MFTVVCHFSYDPFYYTTSVRNKAIQMRNKILLFAKSYLFSFLQPLYDTKSYGNNRTSHDTIFLINMVIKISKAFFCLL